MNNQLHIQLLGNLRIHVNGTSKCQLNKSSRAQLLFAYLLLNRNRSCSRDEIAFCFWPDTTDRQARTNLRKLLYDTRKWVPYLDHLVDIDVESFQWKPTEPYSLDIHKFEQAVTEGTTMCNSIQLRRSALTKAAELYTADLLVGHYEDWILAERDRLRDLHIFTLQELMSLAEHEQDFRCAIRHGHRILRYEKLHEATYCALIRLHRLCGERGLAIKIYERCERVLDEMLDVAPCAETRAEFARVV